MLTHAMVMVTQNALARVKVLTLRTLQDLQGRQTRLVVVDNASSDGTRQWLDHLAHRGDIDLIAGAHDLGYNGAPALARQHLTRHGLIPLPQDRAPLSEAELAQLIGSPCGLTDCAGDALVSAAHNETRDVVVVLGLRCRPDQPQRLRNARAVLQALNHQTLARWRYRIVVVEQDATPRLETALSPLCDQYLFTYNPGPYNRGWSFNVGAVLPGSRSGALCLIDGDLLVPYPFLQETLAALESGARVVHPFDKIVFPDDCESRRAIRNRASNQGADFDAACYRGHIYQGCVGGCLWVDAAFYRDIGGHDERFEGWGEEDLEFWNRASASTPIRRLPGLGLHLDHPAATPEERRSNRSLMASIRAGLGGEPEGRIGQPDRYVNQPLSAMP